MLQPLGNKLVVKLLKKENKTPSGILLSRPDDGEVNRGLVEAVGPNVLDVMPGELVLLDWNKAIVLDKNEMTFVVTEDNVVAILGVDEE